MCKINPLSEIRAIAETSRRKCLPANARLLWRVLFDCANDRQERNADNTYDWPEGFFPITNDELRSNSALEKRALLEARNALKEIGAVDFIPGENNRRPAMYRIRYLTACRGGSVPARGTAKAPAYEPADVPIYQDIYKEKNRIKGYDAEEDDDDDLRARTREGEEDEDPVTDRAERNRIILEGFRYYFGRKPNPHELERLAFSSWRIGQPPETVLLAMRQAAVYDAKSPVSYMLTVLSDWAQHEVYQPHQVEEYQTQYLQYCGENTLSHMMRPMQDKEWEEAIEKRRIENERAGLGN